MGFRKTISLFLQHFPLFALCGLHSSSCVLCDCKRVAVFRHSHPDVCTADVSYRTLPPQVLHHPLTTSPTHHPNSRCLKQVPLGNGMCFGLVRGFFLGSDTSLMLEREVSSDQWIWNEAALRQATLTRKYFCGSKMESRSSDSGPTKLLAGVWVSGHPTARQRCIYGPCCGMFRFSS